MVDKISIIIPIYNARNTLEKTLMSLDIQTMRNMLEVYLIDDASKDKYDDIINLPLYGFIKFLKGIKTFGGRRCRAYLLSQG